MKVEKFTTALLQMDRITIHRIFNEMSQDRDSFQLIEELIVPALEVIGKGWEEGTVALSQVYMSGRIVEDLVDGILSINYSQRVDQPKMAIVVVEDYHLLGKRIIYSMLRASGYDILDFGRVTVDELVDRIKTEQVKIVLISVLMLQSALQIRKVREKLNNEGLDVKIIVGGAPFRFDENLYSEVGADGTAVNVKQTKILIEKTIEEV